MYVYRDRLGDWTGLHVVADVIGKRVDIHLGERVGTKPFNISRIKIYLLPTAKKLDMTVSTAREDAYVR